MTGRIHYTDADGINAIPVTEAEPLPVTAGTGASATEVQGTAADGAAVAGKPVRVAGKDGSGNTQDITTDTGGNLVVVGNVASGVADSGNPVKVAGVYNSTRPTLSTGQRADIQLGARGAVVVQHVLGDSASLVSGGSGADGLTNAVNALHSLSLGLAFNGTSWDRVRGDANAIAVQSALSANFWNYAAATGGINNSSTAVTIKAAGAAGVRNYLKSLQVSHATLGASTELAIRDGAGGTVLWRTVLHTTALPTTTYEFDPPLKGTAATLMEVVTLTNVTGAVMVNGQGFTGA